MILATRRSRPVVIVALLTAASGGVSSTSCLRQARGEDPKDTIQPLTKVFLDSGAKREDREDALDRALALARNKKKPAHAQLFRPALTSLLSDLKSKKADPAFAHFIELALKGISVYDPPDADIAALARPYLAADCPDTIKTEAVRALGPYGTAGMTKELLAIVEDFAKPVAAVEGTGGNAAPPPAPGAGAGGHREPLLRLICVVATCDETPTVDALQLLQGVVKQTVFPGARREACRELGDFAARRNSSEVRAPDMAKALLGACGVDEPDQNLACAAAEALWRFGNPDGFNQLAKRLDDKRKCTKEIYSSLCGAVHAVNGFNNVPPARFTEFDPVTRTGAAAALKDAWAKASTQSPDDALFEALAANGVNVPKNRDIANKETIDALIDGLELEPKDLRYGCLDRLAHRTTRRAEVRLFKTLKEVSGPSNAQLTITQEEPPTGFTSPVQTEKLRAQQKERVKEWRSWWKSFSQKATLQAGVWTAPSK